MNSPAKTDGRTLRHQHRRPELLDAAVDYVTERGLAALSLRPLAEALGITAPTLLHHFGSKEDLASAISSRAQERGFERLGARLAQDVPPADALRAELDFQTEQAAPSMRFFFELYGLALQEPEQYRDFLASVVTPWIPVIEETLQRDGCPPAHSEALATLVLAAARGLVLDRLTQGDRERTDRALDLLELLLETLKSPPPTDGG